jgi:hypothetical protein
MHNFITELSEFHGQQYSNHKEKVQREIKVVIKQAEMLHKIREKEMQSPTMREVLKGQDVKNILKLLKLERGE